MSHHPVFHIYAPRPIECMDRFYKIPPLQQDLISNLRANGFEVCINSAEPAKYNNLRGINGFIYFLNHNQPTLRTIASQEDLDTLELAGVVPMCVHYYNVKLNREELEIIRNAFLHLYGLGGASPRLTRQQAKLCKYWTPAPRSYVIMSSPEVPNFQSL